MYKCYKYECTNKNDLNKKSQFIYSKRGPDREQYYDVMTSATTILNMKALGLVVSDKKIFESFIL